MIKSYMIMQTYHITLMIVSVLLLTLCIYDAASKHAFILNNDIYIQINDVLTYFFYEILQSLKVISVTVKSFGLQTEYHAGKTLLLIRRIWEINLQVQTGQMIPPRWISIL